MKMATKVHILLSLNVLLTLFSFLVVQTFSSYDKEITSKFVSDFLGSKKGDKVKGLDQIKQYFVKYGYLMHNPSTFGSHQLIRDNTEDEGFEVLDDVIEEAIRKYQLFYHLNVTGVLDEHTLSLMTKPRCGFPDLINGTTIKHAWNEASSRSNKTFLRTYYATDSKWDKLILTWATKPGTRDDARQPIFSALREWELVTRFHFVQSNDFEKADLKISFHCRNEAGNYELPFDGPGGTLAHSWTPPTGVVHFDADENWVIGVVPDRFDIETIALHELGHALGLLHSTVEAAIMWPYCPSGATKHLNADDIEGIKELYQFPKVN